MICCTFTGFRVSRMELYDVASPLSMIRREEVMLLLCETFGGNRDFEGDRAVRRYVQGGRGVRQEHVVAIAYCGSAKTM